jgi:hypothetical protein
MRITTVESFSRPTTSHPPNAVLTGRVIPFRPELDPDISQILEKNENHRHLCANRLAADAYAMTDPLEYFFYSVISGAAVVSVLIGILTLPGTDPAKSELLKAGTSQAFESSLMVQNRS